jgi:outer membrane receptor protein involved in Fe transport
LTYREADFSFNPDNLSVNQNFIDPIAGVGPNESSSGKFDVAEIYGELLIPIVADGPAGVEHFSVELGGRISDWSMPAIENLNTYKALIDWGLTPKHRLRGGYNRAHRAPNLGELFIARTQFFQGSASQYQDQCSQNNQTAPFSANPVVAGPAQAAQTYAICRALMGLTGAAVYYDSRPVVQQPTGVGPVGGGNGIQNAFGNPNLLEEQADTFTLGVVMDILENWTLTVDYYTIEIEDMIAVQSADQAYENCLSIAKNPAGDPNTPACQRILRNPTNGTPANVDLTYTNQGRAKVSGVDLQLNWLKTLANGGFNLSLLANYNVESETQDQADAATIDWAGTLGCGLQIDCQGYDYRLFTTLNYFRGPWAASLRHQHWPEILDASCIAAPAGTGCRYGGVQQSYQLFALSGSYAFREKYTLRFGIENLLDEEPPLRGGDPNALPFPIAPTHIGSPFAPDGGTTTGATYDPLGRRGFVSMTMEF